MMRVICVILRMQKSFWFNRISLTLTEEQLVLFLKIVVCMALVQHASGKHHSWGTKKPHTYPILVLVLRQRV